MSNAYEDETLGLSLAHCCLNQSFVTGNQTKTMKMKLTLIALVSLTLLTFNSLCPAFSLAGTAFTYQGRLDDSIGPVTGTYDLTFSVYDSSDVSGSLIAGPFTNSATAVSNGLFTVTLDFGASVFNLSDRWLEIGVRTNGTTAFATLAPRQHVTPVPYAITAFNAAVLLGQLPASQLSGTLSTAQLPSTVALLNSNQVFSGAVTFNNLSNSFAGSGAGLSGVLFSALNGTGIESLNFGNLVFGNYYFPTSAPVAVGDMNGDGKMDLITVDHLGTVLVLTNNGNSGFSLLSSNSTAPSIQVASVTDVNGDGKQDVVTVSSNAVAVFTNSGSGRIVLASFTPTGIGVQTLATADFNGDGKPDVVVIGGSSVIVMTNNGNAGFGFFATLPGTGPNDWCVIAADVNGDNRMDIICSQLSASPSTGNLTVFTNNNGTGFVLCSTPVTGANPLSIAAADFNGDGRIDLATADYGAFGAGQSISVLLNDGTGNFATSTALINAAGPAQVVTADINGDKKTDILVASAGANSEGPRAISVLTNDGSGNVTLSFVLSNQVSVLTADVNGDGRADVISSIFATNGNAIVSIPDTWLNSPSALTFLVPVVTQNGFTANGVAVFNNPASVFNGTFSGNGSGLTSLNASSITSGTLADARLSVNVALLNANQTFTGTNTYNNALNINSNVFFGTGAGRQMLNLWGTQYGIGVQSYTTYFRTDNSFPGGDFAWYQGGIHNDAQLNPGGGKTLMVLDNAGNLRVTNNVYAAGVQLTSDRNAKENFTPIDPVAALSRVISLPVTEWNYKNEGAETKHIGPVAQDFHAAFGLNGGDDKHISSVDEGGVALAAIQGLNEKLQADNASLRQENDLLAKRLDTLEAEVKALARNNR